MNSMRDIPTTTTAVQGTISRPLRILITITLLFLLHITTLVSAYAGCDWPSYFFKHGSFDAGLGNSYSTAQLTIDEGLAERIRFDIGRFTEDSVDFSDTVLYFDIALSTSTSDPADDPDDDTSVVKWRGNISAVYCTTDRCGDDIHNTSTHAEVVIDDLDAGDYYIHARSVCVDSANDIPNSRDFNPGTLANSSTSSWKTYQKSSSDEKVTVAPFTFTVADSDDDDPDWEVRKEFPLTYPEHLASPFARWGLLDSEAACTSSANLYNSFTLKTTGREGGLTSLVVSTESANSKYACVKVTYDGTDYYDTTGLITKIDRTIPRILPTPLANEAADGFITAAEKTATNPLFTYTDGVTITDALDSDPEVRSKIISGINPCDYRTTFDSDDVPENMNTDDVTADGRHSVCIRARDHASNDAYRRTDFFIRDTVVPTLDIDVTLTGAKEARDGNNIDYLNTGDTMDITVTASEDTRAGSITATLGGLATNRSIVLTKDDATTYTGSYTIRDGDDSTAITLDIPEAAIFDVAGNPAADHAAYRFNEDKSDLGRSSGLAIDTIPPAAPTGLDLAAADDTCADFNGTAGCDFGSNTDNITSQRENLTIEVTAEAYAAITLEGGSSPVLPPQAIASTTKTAEITLNNADGRYTITAAQLDQAHNVSPVSEPLIITLDRTAPTQPFAPDLPQSMDTGVSGSDNLTNLASVVFETGHHTRTQECRFVFEGIGSFTASSAHRCVSESARINVDGQQRNFIYPSFYTNTTEGKETFRTRAYDLAGNYRTSGSITVHFDRTVAEATLAVSTSSDTGYKNDDRITNDNTPDITLGGLEFSTAPTDGTGRAAVTVYDWTDSNNNNQFLSGGEPVLSELSAHRSISDVTATSMDITLAALTDGVKRLVLKQEDDAGNISWSAVSKVAYDDTTGIKGDNVIIIDTVAPLPPEAPDLSPHSDTYGANNNHARDGADDDDLTYEHAMLFRSLPAVRDTDDTADKTGAARTREHHHITFSVFDSTEATGGTPANGASAPALAGNGIISAGNPDAATANNREISNIKDGRTVTSAGFPNEYAATITHDFAGTVPADSTGSVFIGAKQYDAAGNVSAWSTVKEVTLDREKPDLATFANDLILHARSDTGETNDDRRTANTAPIFTMQWPDGISPPADIDYYELHRALLDENGETTEAFSYPSNSANRDQASFDWVDPENKDTGAPLEDETTLAATLDQYTTGVAVKIFRQSTPQANRRYGYRLAAVDRAGNTTLGVDQTNPFFTVPPPTPTAPALSTTSDSGDRNNDKVTNETEWTLTTTYKNTSDAEQEGAAAQNLRTLRFTVTDPDGTIRTADFTRDPGTSADNNGFDIPTDEAANLTADDYTAEYSFTGTVNLIELFGNTLTQGDYTISVQGRNAQRESGSASTALTVTLDTQAPIIGETLLPVTSRYTAADDSVKYRFTITGTIEEEHTFVTVHYEPSVTRSASIAYGSMTIEVPAQPMTSYRISARDIAGNILEKAPYPQAAYPPDIFSYLVSSGSPNNSYLIAAAARSGSELTPAGAPVFKRYTKHNTNGCRFTPGTTETTYTPNTVEQIPADTCIMATDTSGNTAAVNVSAEAVNLITNTGILTADNTRDTDDITNSPNPRYTGSTIPGSAVRIQTKQSTDTWDNAHEERTAADDTGSFTTTRLLAAAVTTGTQTIDVRGYITNNELLPGLGEIGPITLTAVTIDVEPPTVTLALSDPASSPGNDDTPTFSVTTEADTTVTLHKGNGCTDPISDAQAFTTATDTITADTLTDDGAYTITAEAEDTAGNTACSEAADYLLDTEAPAVIIIRSGNDYRAVADEETTALSADSTAKASCQTTTSGSAYTPGDAVTDANGNRCFIFTDTAGNKEAAHTDDAIDSVGAIRFTDGTADGTFHFTRSGSREVTGRSAPGAHIKLWTTDGTTPAAADPAATAIADEAGLITTTVSIDPAHTALYAAVDLDGSGSFTPPARVGTLVIDDTPPTITPVAVQAFSGFVRLRDATADLHFETLTANRYDITDGTLPPLHTVLTAEDNDGTIGYSKDEQGDLSIKQFELDGTAYTVTALTVQGTALSVRLKDMTGEETLTLLEDYVLVFKDTAHIPVTGTATAAAAVIPVTADIAGMITDGAEVRVVLTKLHNRFTGDSTPLYLDGIGLNIKDNTLSAAVRRFTDNTPVTDTLGTYTLTIGTDLITRVNSNGAITDTIPQLTVPDAVIEITAEKQVDDEDFIWTGRVTADANGYYTQTIPLQNAVDYEGTAIAAEDIPGEWVISTSRIRHAEVFTTRMDADRSTVSFPGAFLDIGRVSGTVTVTYTKGDYSISEQVLYANGILIRPRTINLANAENSGGTAIPAGSINGFWAVSITQERGEDLKDTTFIYTGTNPTTTGYAGLLAIPDTYPVTLSFNDRNTYLTSDNDNPAYATTGDRISLNSPAVSEGLNDIIVTVAGSVLSGCAVSDGQLTCTPLLITDAVPEGPVTLSITARDPAGNTVAVSAPGGITVDRTPPTYTLTAAQSAGRPGDTIPVTVNLRDASPIFFNGKPIGGNNPLIVRVGRNSNDVTVFPTTIQHLIPETAVSALQGVTVPTVSDAAGNTTVGYTEGLFFIDTRAPSVESVDFSTTGTTMTVSAVVDRNNSSSMIGDEAVRFIFTGACEEFPVSPYFTDSADKDNTRYTYTITIPRETFDAETCHFIAEDAVGNRQQEGEDTAIYVPITGSRRGGGGGGGGGGGIGLFKFNTDTTDNESETGIVVPIVEAVEGTEETTALDLITETTPEPEPITLRRGDRHEDIRRIQQELNKRGHTVAQTGPGSPGRETDYFGPATENALRAFQISQSLPATGVFDPVTRQALLTDKRQTLINELKRKIAEIQQRITELLAQQAPYTPPVEETPEETQQQYVPLQEDEPFWVVPTTTTTTRTYNAPQFEAQGGTVIVQTPETPEEETPEEIEVYLPPATEETPFWEQDTTTTTTPTFIPAAFETVVETAEETPEQYIPPAPTPTATYQFGDTHEDIAEVQRLLSTTACPVEQVTGTFDAATRSAVICYQKQTGLPLTGTITPEMVVLLRG